MRIARDLGDVSSLLPEGITNLADAPYTLHIAIRTGLRILGYEEFPSDERPPKRVWLDADGLKEWFDEVEERRKAGTEAPSDKPDIRKEYERSPLGPAEVNAVELIKRG